MDMLQGLLADNFAGFSLKSLPGFIFAFIVCGILCFVLSRLYVRFGSSLSNRRAFGRTFILLGITTMFIITVVKSSLALSLGLVGALSIVRFRAAIKEPEELTYLLVTIAVGLGCGAGLPILTTLAFGGFALAIVLINRYKRETHGQSLYLTLSSSGSLNVKEVGDVLKPYVLSWKLKRTDETAGSTELSFLLELENPATSTEISGDLKKQFPGVSLTLMDSSRDI